MVDAVRNSAQLILSFTSLLQIMLLLKDVTPSLGS